MQLPEIWRENAPASQVDPVLQLDNPKHRHVGLSDMSAATGVPGCLAFNQMPFHFDSQIPGDTQTHIHSSLTLERHSFLNPQPSLGYPARSKVHICPLVKPHVSTGNFPGRTQLYSTLKIGTNDCAQDSCLGSGRSDTSNDLLRGLPIPASMSPFLTSRVMSNEDFAMDTPSQRRPSFEESDKLWTGTTTKHSERVSRLGDMDSGLDSKIRFFGSNNFVPGRMLDGNIQCDPLLRDDTSEPSYGNFEVDLHIHSEGNWETSSLFSPLQFENGHHTEDASLEFSNNIGTRAMLSLSTPQVVSHSQSVDNSLQLREQMSTSNPDLPTAPAGESIFSMFASSPRHGKGRNGLRCTPAPEASPAHHQPIQSNPKVQHKRGDLLSLRDICKPELGPKRDLSTAGTYANSSYTNDNNAEGSPHRETVVPLVTKRIKTDRYGDLPREVQLRIESLRRKVAKMPRRKLRGCLARDVTLEEIEPLMIVNRDDLATMLSLGVTTWKSFVHNELGVSRWPARMLKSTWNKIRDARERLSLALNEGRDDDTRSIQDDIRRLHAEQAGAMRKLRLAAKQRQLSRSNSPSSQENNMNTTTHAISIDR